MGASVIIAFNLITFLAIYFLSKKTVNGAVLLLVISIIIHLLMVDASPSNWLRKIALDDQKSHDSIIFSLDQCAPNFGLDICRKLYNKPIFLINKITTGVLLQFSEENILSFLKVPFKGLLVVICYVGIFGLLVRRAGGNTIFILRLWLILYALLGVFGNYNSIVSMSSSIFLIVLAGYGLLITISVINNAYDCIKK